MATAFAQQFQRSWELSVPSAGRSGWQRRFPALCPSGAIFQYPQRVVVDGNFVPLRRSHVVRDFQYPQRVVVDGNLERGSSVHVIGLSVPSAGRSGWQPF